MTLEDVNRITEALKARVGETIIGQDASITLLLVSLLTGGHILLEGVPGTGKTLLVRAFAAALSLRFGRIQFTPDLMPGDVLGTNLFDSRTNQFVLTKGPIFTELLLADEVNRTPPKTQAALLQAMQERSVTIDDSTHDLGTGFMVIATQNPIEQQGTYPLPEAQLDRFLFKHVLDYPTRDEEKSIVRLHSGSDLHLSNTTSSAPAITDLGRLTEIRALVRGLRFADRIVEYIVDVVRATREHPSFQFGASPRSANMLAAASRAYAALAGRDYVIPDDVKFLAGPVLRHRVVLAPGAEPEGLAADEIIEQILESKEAPR